MFFRRFVLAVHQISLLWIIAKPTEQIPTRISVRDYHCDSAAESAYVQAAASNLKRFVRHREELYFVFSNKIVFTSLPILQKDEHNRSFFIHYNFYEQIAEEEALPNSKVIGHIYDSDAITAQEIHSTGQSDRPCATGKAYGLAFSDQLAKRDHQVQLNADLLEHLNEKRSCKTNYVDVLKSNTTQVVFGFSGESRKLSAELGNDFKEAFSLNFSNIRFFVVPKFEDEADFYQFNIVWIEEESFEVNYESYIVHKPRPELIEKQTQFKATFDELLSCHSKVTNPRQFKGIYFDRATSKFFIFIKRFYLQLDGDLVFGSFLLPDSVYAKNAHELDYGDELKEFAVFNDQTKPWVKTHPDKAYLMPSSEIFEIATSQDKLAIRRAQHPSIVACRENVLVFEGRYSFCFEEDKYYYLQDTRAGLQSTERAEERLEIHSIFSPFSLIHWHSQSVKFTFNYKGDHFVMMTRSFLYVFDYKDFQVSRSNRTIRFLNKHGSKRTLNCLFEGSSCSRAMLVTDPDEIVTGTTTLSTDPDEIVTPDPSTNTTSTPKIEDQSEDQSKDQTSNWKTGEVQTPKPGMINWFWLHERVWFPVIWILGLLLALLGILCLIRLICRRPARARKADELPNELTKGEPAKAAPAGKPVLPVKGQSQPKLLKALPKGSNGSPIQGNLNSAMSSAGSEMATSRKQSQLDSTMSFGSSKIATSKGQSQLDSGMSLAGSKIAPSKERSQLDSVMSLASSKISTNPKALTKTVAKQGSRAKTQLPK